MKKLSALILIICMTLTMIPIPAFAVGEGMEGTVGTDVQQQEIPSMTEPVVDLVAEPEPEPELGLVPEPEPEPEPAQAAEALLDEPLTDGWVTDAEGNLYYYEGGVPVTGFHDIDGARYYFNEAGIMQTGWIRDEAGSRYYFGADGIMLTGFQQINDKTYYFKETGVMQTGLKKIDGVRYYFKPSGVMKTGAVKVNGKLYYFMKDGKGVVSKGWFKGIDGKKRYCYGNARIAFGTKKIKKIWYEFSKKNGHLIRRIGDNIDKSIQSKTSSTSYLIILKISEHKVRVYNGKQHRWTRIHKFSCTTGASSTPTPKGTYTIKSRGLYFNTGTNMRCWYYTQFYGNYLFHSVLYDRSPTPSHIVDGRLGINASHGCVRLALGNAKWIYQNIPSGTKVVIY